MNVIHLALTVSDGQAIPKHQIFLPGDRGINNSVFATSNPHSLGSIGQTLTTVYITAVNAYAWNIDNGAWVSQASLLGVITFWKGLDCVCLLALSQVFTNLCLYWSLPLMLASCLRPSSQILTMTTSVHCPSSVCTATFKENLGQQKYHILTFNNQYHSSNIQLLWNK